MEKTKKANKSKTIKTEGLASAIRRDYQLYLMLLPEGITFASYREVAKIDHLFSTYVNAVIYTVFGAVLSVVLTILAAYPTSKKRLALGDEEP